MTPQEAAAALRPTFNLEAMPPEDRHHVLFVEAVAAELGVAPTAFNLYQVAEALDKAGLHPESNEYPKMLYSRQHHAEDVAASVYDRRHDYVWVHVESADEAAKLGAGWVENPADLPPRGDIPLHAEREAAEPAQDDAYVEVGPYVAEDIAAPADRVVDIAGETAPPLGGNS